MHYSTHFLRHTRFMVGKNIQKHRRGNQLSLTELAQMSGVDEGIITRYENARGEVHFPCLVRIACALKIAPRELLP